MKKQNCSSPVSVGVNALEALKPPYEDAYQHMRAQCRSTGPGHWARPRTWWRWSRVACSLDCIQTAPPCQCQSRSLPASRSAALGLSCTEWSLSWGQLWGGKEKEQERTEDRNKAEWWVCVVERWWEEGGREIIKPLLISSHVISRPCLPCQARLFESIISCSEQWAVWAEEMKKKGSYLGKQSEILWLFLFHLQ